VSKSLSVHMFSDRSEADKAGEYFEWVGKKQKELLRRQGAFNNAFKLLAFDVQLSCLACMSSEQASLFHEIELFVQFLEKNRPESDEQN